NEFATLLQPQQTTSASSSLPASQSHPARARETSRHSRTVTTPNIVRPKYPAAAAATALTNTLGHSRHPEHNSTTTPLPYKKLTPVQHAKFGVGIVQKCEPRGSAQFTVTVLFRSGAVKTIDAKFLTRI
ncbi:MAG TPA: hypothetical protein VJJ83_00590, partial [Candidatus Babeliales bacterium]|nr:hypothetical protein [Candidatus Babeliales bacterium]